MEAIQMKQILAFIIMCFTFITLIGCDSIHLCSFDILCSNENIRVTVEDKSYDSFTFSSENFNRQPLTRYSYIDFTVNDENNSSAEMHKFEFISLTDDTYNLSLKLVDANKYVIDFLRVAIIIDGELRVYKYYDQNEKIYHKEDDPDSILYFNSQTEIFNELTFELKAGEPKEVTVFYWIEQAELYDKNGNRYTGWADKSYDASPIMLSMEVK